MTDGTNPFFTPGPVPGASSKNKRFTLRFGGRMPAAGLGGGVANILLVSTVDGDNLPLAFVPTTADEDVSVRAQNLPFLGGENDCIFINLARFTQSQAQNATRDITFQLRRMIVADAWANVGTAIALAGAGAAAGATDAQALQTVRVARTDRIAVQVTVSGAGVAGFVASNLTVELDCTIV